MQLNCVISSQYQFFFLNFFFSCIQYAILHFFSSAGSPHFKIPQTVTCHILSSEALTALSTASLSEDNTKESAEQSSASDLGNCGLPEIDIAKEKSLSNLYGNSFLVLAGLHACGDLSVNMLR